LSSLISILVSMCFVISAGSEPQPLVQVAQTAPGTWTMDVYNAKGALYQDPDPTSCTAATAQMALNMAALAQTGEAGPVRVTDGRSVRFPGGPVFKWTLSTGRKTTATLLKYERATTSTRPGVGSDPHGERNALNYYGWGSLDAGVYQDMAFATFDQAAKATVQSIAATGKPVIVFGINGKHAQLVTGFTATGSDPRTSMDFAVVSVKLTDPLLREYHRDTTLSYATWRSGPLDVRFGADWETWESTGRDPVDGLVGATEWRGNWVIVAAVH
jgi:hypothetical protein